MIEVEHLTKYYGSHLAVDDLSFKIDENHVYGFLGPNGAGKSTTMNIITGCLSPSAGTVKINGYDIFLEPIKAKSYIGYLPEIPPLYQNETVNEYLKFICDIKKVKKEDISSSIQNVIDVCKLEDVKDRLISKLSKGYRQRVGIAEALLGNPEIIILDEPTVGLDPLQIIEIRNLIKDLGKEHTVILSSHILSEVQAICEEVLIINKGKLLAFDKTDELTKKFDNNHNVIFKTDASKEIIEDILKDIEGIKDYEIKDEKPYEVVVTVSKNAQKISQNIMKEFLDKGENILEITTKKANLEDIFIELTEGDENYEGDNNQ